MLFVLFNSHFVVQRLLLWSKGRKMLLFSTVAPQTLLAHRSVSSTTHSIISLHSRTQIAIKRSDLPQDFPSKVTRFIQISTQFYSSESARKDELLPSLCTLLDTDLHDVHSTGVNSDELAVTVASDQGFDVSFLIFELKQEIGVGGCDPWMQACKAYQKYWSPDKCA